MSALLLALWTMAAAESPQITLPSEPAPGADVARDEAVMGLDPADVVGEPAGTPLAGDELHEATREVAVLLRCPTCQGMSVAESPAEGARAMRAEVERMMARGFSAEQSIDWFVASYGEFILLAPRKKGANLALWIGPVALVTLGAIGIAMRVARHRRKTTGGDTGATGRPAAAAAGPADYRSQVEREVGK